MRWTWSWRLLATGCLLAGCDQVFRLKPYEAGTIDTQDLDLDGIFDGEDDCIASAVDGAIDSDNDGPTNDVDPCPFDSNAVLDVDNDLIPDACDPFPQVAGDRRRCTMAFMNSDLNARIWHEREDGMQWQAISTAGLRSKVDATGSLVAVTDLDSARVPTFDVLAHIQGEPGATKAFRLWVRAAATPDPSDLACEHRGNSVGSTLSIIDGSGAVLATTSAGGPFVLANNVRMIATVDRESGIPGLRCALNYFSPTVVRANVAVPVGRVGFGVEASELTIYGMAIYERDAPQDL